MFKYLKIFVIIGIVTSVVGDEDVINKKPGQNKPTPIVLWHGMGDACCLPFSLGPFKSFLEEKIPGVYVHSIMIGKSITEDIENGYLKSPNKQVALVCEALKSNPELKDGFHAIGFSQGGQFLRAVVQRCGDKVRVKNLITLGAQHQGVYGLPNCGALKHETCDYIRRLLNYAAYYDWMQHRLVQATYWHDPLNELLYKTKSDFLADINNEMHRNVTYIVNLLNLEHMVMVKFEDDTVVQPKETEWFGFYAPGQAEVVLPLRYTDTYINDQLGLQTMNRKGKLVFLSSPGNHLHFSDKWFVSEILTPYLL